MYDWLVVCSRPSPSTSTTKPKLTTRVLESTQNLRSRLSTLTPHENIYNLPNILTFSRLLAAPMVGYLILHNHHLYAVSLFIYAGLTDLVDGYLARRYSLQTVVGSVVDPMADKLLVTIVVVCLAANGTLPLWLATLMFGRDASLGLAAIYYRYASLPVPKTFTRYWDFSLPSAQVYPTTVSKYNTFLQLCLIGATTALPLVTGQQIMGAVGVVEAVKGLQYVVAATTLWSGASYVFLKDAVKILGEDEELKRKQGFRGRAIIGWSFAGVVGLAGWFWVREGRKDVVEEARSR
ncbi:hypothetical protein LTS18_010418 [Coniosporium uncinatum]|uniref:Uncharacterized protein n=1 Tax=Coniosporium uncinatum TaxID=93489 RepID=A0ACC3DWJ7_9PEZI|nr:hypothetical protein LTS18_010418 [Coniosporium uncinatum]